MRSVSSTICVQLRFSLSFSMPRWRYPMTTSQSTTFSPSSRSTTRRTPCVLGCCGPMLITSSLVSNIAPWWTVCVSIKNSVGEWRRDSGFGIWDLQNPESQRIPKSQRIPNPSESRIPTRSLDLCFFPCLSELQPVERILHQQLAGTFERIVLALGESLPVLGHEDAPAIGMAGEVHPEHVVHLALEPVGRSPHAGDRRNRLMRRDLHLQPHAVSMPRRVQHVQTVESPFGPRRPVGRRE